MSEDLSSNLESFYSKVEKGLLLHQLFKPNLNEITFHLNLDITFELDGFNTRCRSFFGSHWNCSFARLGYIPES